MIRILLFTLLVGLARFCEAQSNQACATNYQLCAFSGASGQLPDLGPDFANLFVDLIDTVNAKPAVSGGPVVSATTTNSLNPTTIGNTTICCMTNTKCLLLNEYNLPICYDQFTTNFFLPDGSFGTLDNGSYYAASGAQANLIYGNYTLQDGPTGNIYQVVTTDRPNTSTLAMPTPYTASGVGSAIPASALGGLATYTNTDPGTTTAPMTLQPSVAIASFTETATTIPGHTINGTTLPPVTIPYKSTITTNRPVTTKPPKTSKASYIEKGLPASLLVIMACAFSVTFLPPGHALCFLGGCIVASGINIFRIHLMTRGEPDGLFT